VEAEVEHPLGLLCFLNDTRECNASCMAWITHPSGCGPELNEVQSHCMLITGVERIARHTTIIASGLADSEKKRRIAEADKRREKSMPLTPKPMPMQSPFPKKSNEF
jgi:hypothetical protein